MSKKNEASIIDQKEKIQDFTFAYRMYISSRRDFLIGVSLGIIGSIAATYIVELDKRLFSVSSLTAFHVFTRIFFLALILSYLVYRYSRRTQIYENSLKGMIDRINEINRDLEKRNKNT